MANQPWFRKQNRTSYRSFGGKQVNLGKDEDAALNEEHNNDGPKRRHPRGANGWRSRTIFWQDLRNPGSREPSKSA
jgi:hypothetical protein